MTNLTDLELITQNRNRKRNRDRTTNTIVYAGLVLIALICLYPFYWTLLTSLETTGGLAFEFPPPWFPKAPGPRNYVDVFSLVPVAQQVLNSLIICSLGVGASVLLATLGAYPLAKMNFPGRDFVFYAILATLVLPNEAGLIVNYMTTVNLGHFLSGILQMDVPRSAWYQFATIIMPALSSTVGLFLMRQAYLSIPLELLEAARMDGASELTVWRRIMLPLTMPTIAAFSILQFVAFWNTFLWPVIVLRDRNLYPLSAGLLDLAGTFSTNTRAISAGAVIQVVPIIIIFLFFQKYFMRGLEGAVKG
jgi:putative chitobiose transport system permease protein